MHSSRALVATFAGALSLLACTPESTSDAGNADAGGAQPEPDAGSTPDAGDEPLDAGEPDGGHVDAGAADGGVDAGVDGGGELPDDGGADGGGDVDAGAACTWSGDNPFPVASSIHYQLTWGSASADLDLGLTVDSDEPCDVDTSGRDLDDQNGLGPENIHSASPQDESSYGVWVKHHAGEASTATVRVWLDADLDDGGSTDPAATCVRELSEGDLWHVLELDVADAEVTFTERNALTPAPACQP